MKLDINCWGCAKTLGTVEATTQGPFECQAGTMAAWIAAKGLCSDCWLVLRKGDDPRRIASSTEGHGSLPSERASD